MGWREFSVRYLGPGVLPGLTPARWLRLLRDNRFSVHPFFLLRACNITGSAMLNCVPAAMERWRFGKEIEKQQVRPPLFILGHWRSGTTLLHDLLALDPRFAFPNCFQVMMPHTFMGGEAIGSRLWRFFSPATRPMDNMKLDPAGAWEDEFILGAEAFLTPYLEWTFPNRAGHYERYLTFDGVDPAEVERWRQTLVWFLKKVTLKYGRPLVLKSPTHTARIKLLLELFPDAKFVFIHRHPFAVFRSTMHTHKMVFPLSCLQRGDRVDWEGLVIRQYRKMHDAYLEQRRLIPRGRLHELSFEALEKAPLEEMRKAYRALALPDFAEVEGKLRDYLESIRDYKKNTFPDLPPELRGRLKREWGRTFDEWAYEG